ncbi:hypothetical protein [Herpetosiphon gulosus]|uniref:Uncharacterized protein n=1 Tax=Herpetosiphon gulosus TaxID=1973496 RepID=A0ABP9WVE0_9CHLR
MRVVVAGAVVWTNALAMQTELASLHSATIVIHGDSPGCDVLAGQIAATLGLTVVSMTKTRADALQYPGEAWKGLNRRMLTSGARLVLIFHPQIALSRGSHHLVELAVAANIPLRIITGDER